MESREEVDGIIAKAQAAGATIPRAPQDHGFMYAHGFDGKITSCKLILDKNTGMSRSFAFVEMPQQAEANKAMTELVCRNTDGTCIIVGKAKPRSAGRAF